MLSELYAYIQYLCFIGMIRSTYRRVYSVSHSDGKTTTERRTAVRETSIMWGPIQSHDETRRTSQYTMVLRSLRGALNWVPIMPRDGSIFFLFIFFLRQRETRASIKYYDKVRKILQTNFFFLAPLGIIGVQLKGP